jgi:rfaE bifunctional protein nucleotidyltransferase chain/domain
MGIVTLDELAALRGQWHHQGLQVILTNGVFDLLHSGHVRYLEQARALGDLLIVAINSDSSTRAIKGPTRPLVPEADRVAVVAALRCVDYVVVFSTPTAENVVAAIQPTYYVKGGDYALPPASQAPQSPIAIDEDRLPEARIARAHGGRVLLIPYLPGHSTSDLIARIKALPPA